MTIDVRATRIYDDAEPRRRSPGADRPRLAPRCLPRACAAGRVGARAGAQRRAAQWFDHVPERFAEFRSRYRDELAGQSDRVGELRRRAQEGAVTIVYAARDTEHNNAVVLAELIRDG
jgi:uncharacterized protein YeaO (DUF488 family)